MKLRKLLLVVSICCVPFGVFAQNKPKILEKPFETWSQDEAMKIISAPPWADQYQSEKSLTAGAMSGSAREQADTRLTGSDRGSSARSTAAPPIVIRLRSAVPVRQAMVRLRQIAAGYDKMKPDDKKKFDQSVDILMNCPACKDYYVVTITKFKDTSMGAVDEGIFQTMKADDFKGKVWLMNEKEEKRELVEFIPPKKGGDDAVFYFERNDSAGAPLITPASSLLKFVFSRDLLERTNNRYSYLIPRFFEFKVSKLVIDGKVEF